MFDMVKAERFCHIHTGVEDSCVTRVKGLSPLRGVGQSPAYPIDQGKLIKSEFQFGVLYILMRKGDSRKEKETMTKREAKKIGRCKGCVFGNQEAGVCIDIPENDECIKEEKKL